MSLVVNEGKTIGVVPRMGSQITANSYNFDVVKEFIYLGTAITTNNDVSLEIKRRVTLANRSYFGFNRQFSSIDLSRATTLPLYKALNLPVLLYGAETWTLSSTDAAALGMFKRKVLRKIFDPVRFGDEHRIRTNREQYKIFNDMFRWFGHVVRMDEGASPRRVFDAVVGGHRQQRRPRTHWKDQAGEALTSLGVTNWRRRSQSIGAYREKSFKAGRSWQDQVLEALTSLGVTNWRRRSQSIDADRERSFKAGRSLILWLLWPHK